MNPETLRAMANWLEGMHYWVEADKARAAADAWEADIAQRDSAQRQAKTFREALLEQNGVVLQLSKRLEAAEPFVAIAKGLRAIWKAKGHGCAEEKMLLVDLAHAVDALAREEKP